MVRIACLFGVIGVFASTVSVVTAEPVTFERDIAPLLKRHCVKCHGPAKQEAKLNLSVPGGLIRGGTNGTSVLPHDADGSLIWQRVTSDEMPPEGPLNAQEKQLLKQWIVDGTQGLGKLDVEVSDHWAFRQLAAQRLSARPSVPDAAYPATQSPVDQFLLGKLAQHQLTYQPEADRATQIRRVSFDLRGLPPTSMEIDDFSRDERPDAYDRMVDRLLASPHFGERLGKVWLDAAGYADSNGYFNADSDRPLAYRYRDYVIRSLNSDKPFDEFIREQIAGDELAEITARPGETVPPPARDAAAAAAARTIELLEATHFLRNGQDGTGESDGNPDEVRIDRYTVLETTMQNISTGLLGLTIQCAKCHDHKFEPLTQRDYYSFQAVLIPAFPPEQWMKPNERILYANRPGELEAWQARLNAAESHASRLESELVTWVRENRPRGTVLFADDFSGAADSMAERWSGTAPGESSPEVTTPVRLNSREAPAAMIVNGHLNLLEGGPAGDKCLSTKKVFDWTPDGVGDAIQVTFDLVANQIDDSKPAERVGYLLSLHDFKANQTSTGGNILVDGHPSSSTAVHTNYPGIQSRSAGTIGKTGYVPGRNYGVRVTKLKDGQFQLQHLVDGVTDEPSIELTEADLSHGAFGFEFCCGRSFVVDNVLVESFTPQGGADALAAFTKELTSRRRPVDEAIKARADLANVRPGKIAITADIVEQPPQVHVFERGNYSTPGQPVEPAGFTILGAAETSTPAAVRSPTSAERRGSGRRLSFANWLTRSDSKPASLMARVHINRLWQHHFGTGIVAAADNFGLSGPIPSHPELLDWMASDFVRSEWRTKRSIRSIVTSAAYRQSSLTSEMSRSDPRWMHDADGRGLSRFPIRRLDAEAIRDSFLVASSDFDDRMYGPYVATTRTSNGETIVAENNPGVRRRSIYLQQRRTQVHSLLQVFDAPSIVFNSTRRARSTMPLQSLSLLNSDFVVARSRFLATSLEQAFPDDTDRQKQAFLITTGRSPSLAEQSILTEFLRNQEAEYGDTSEGRTRAWTDLCQTLLIGNAALYLE